MSRCGAVRSSFHRAGRDQSQRLPFPGCTPDGGARGRAAELRGQRFKAAASPPVPSTKQSYAIRREQHMSIAVKKVRQIRMEMCCTELH